MHHRLLQSEKLRWYMQDVIAPRAATFSAAMIAWIWPEIESDCGSFPIDASGDYDTHHSTRSANRARVKCMVGYARYF